MLHFLDVPAMQARDVAIFSSFGDARYLTGLDGLPEVRPIFSVLTPTGKVELAAPVIEANIIRRRVSPELGVVSVEWGEWNQPVMARTFDRAIFQLVSKLAPDAKIIGLDFALSGNDLNLLRNAFQGKAIEDVSPVALGVRSTKDDTLTEIVTLGVKVAMDSSLAFATRPTPAYLSGRLRLLALMLV